MIGFIKWPSDNIIKSRLCYDNLYNMYIINEMSADNISLITEIDCSFVVYYLYYYRLVSRRIKPFKKNLNELIIYDQFINNLYSIIINNAVFEYDEEIDSIESEIHHIESMLDLIDDIRSCYNLVEFSIDQDINKCNADISRLDEMYDINMLFMNNKTCFRCSQNKGGCMHHLVPRQFGGNNLITNLVFLCDECHDAVEIYTYELFNKNIILDTRVLKSYIIGGFPDEHLCM